jgi:hypothetical protein
MKGVSTMPGKLTYQPKLSRQYHHMAFRSLGSDLVRPLQKALGGFTHLLVTIDKFSKWIEA